MRKHLFSVITTAYNDENYIKRAMDSVLAQTFDDFEYIVIDNGSFKDGTAGLLDDYKREHVNYDIKVIHLIENQGISGGRNAGINIARGKYVCILDSDDLWNKDKLLEVKKITDTHPEVDVIWHWENHVSDRKCVLAKYRRVDNRCPFEDLLSRGNCLSPSATVVKRETLLDIGGFDVKRVGGEEDFDCWLRLAAAGASFYLIKKPLGIWTIRSDSLSASKLNHAEAVENMLEDHLDVLKGRVSPVRFKNISNRLHARSDYIRGVYYGSMGQIEKAKECIAGSIYKNPLNLKAYYRYLEMMVKH